MTAELPLALAQAIVAAALAAGRDAGLRASAAVVDAGGHLIAFARDDGAPFLPGEVARAKAWTAAAAGLPTAQWNAFLADPQCAPIAALPGLMAVPGGLPLIRDGRILGGLGVSGGAPAQDQAVAEAALRTTTDLAG